MGNGFGTWSLASGLICIPISAGAAILSTIFQVGSLFGLLSPLLQALSIVGWVLPCIAVILGFIGILVDNSRGRAIVGFNLGLLGILFGIVIRIILENTFTPIYI